jgi:hypothetical protein
VVVRLHLLARLLLLLLLEPRIQLFEHFSRQIVEVTVYYGLYERVVEVEVVVRVDPELGLDSRKIRIVPQLYFGLDLDTDVVSIVKAQPMNFWIFIMIIRIAIT